MSFLLQAEKVAEVLYRGREHAQLTVGILEDGKIETVHFDEKMEISPEQLIYPAGSIGKPFTASLLAKKIYEGKIRLDDQLDCFIKGLPGKYYPTIRRLLTHHSGYGGAPFGFIETLIRFAKMNDEKGLLHVNPFRGTLREAEMMKILKKKKLKDQEYPFAYSNFAYGVLGYILGMLEGRDYFTVMQHYLEELGLKDTSLNNLAWTGYDKKGNPCKPWQWEPEDIIAPAGAMIATMEDLLKFAEINMDGSQPYLEMLHQKYAEGEKGFDQGLAWRLKKNSDISYHVGSAGAFSCILAMDRKKKKAVAIGLNYALVDEIEDLAFSLLEGTDPQKE